MQKRIGLYGGSFDPVHVGHSAIAHSFIHSGFIDELWILLTPISPHKINSKPTLYSDRLRMLKRAFRSVERVKISIVESELPKPNFTYRTIEYLVEDNPNCKFYYCLGSDSLEKFHTWKHPEKILSKTQLLVAGRSGSDYTEISDFILNKTHIVEHEPVDVSSTEINALLKGNKSVEGLVHPDVESYIRTHQLYLSK